MFPVRKSLFWSLMLVGVSGSSVWADGARRPGGEGRPSRDEILKRFDKNGDGQLNEGERQALQAAIANRGGKPGMDRAGGMRPGMRRPDGGKPGGAGANREKVLKQFDANGNGKLDPAEIATARAALEGRKGK